ncbi:MAG TPA: enoyl-CoA hydratase-related protein [Candidatus Dormibacteraeota bacterium]|nr:enoyl-CoA hydratase-related protein [Candidatus Dormibacteraeota bacterium]
MAEARRGDAPVRVELPARRPDRPGAVSDGVALVTIDRPRAMNALDFELLRRLAGALEDLDLDATVRCIVLTGAGTRAFAAGADIKELAEQTPVTLTSSRAFETWDRIDRVGLPVVAAVRGYALGGGCELAMACDLIVAGEDAVFGQPEVRLGVMPGAGGTQRLTRAVGKARAMEMILTGRRLSAREAEAAGLVTSVVPAEATLAVALDLAERIASQPPLAVRAAKQAILRAFELPLSAGLDHERRAFFSLFATEDQTEGMTAFAEKREPRWTGR